MTEDYVLYVCPNGCTYLHSSDWLALRIGTICPFCKEPMKKNEADKGEVMTESKDPVELLDLAVGQHQAFKALEENLIELNSKLDQVRVELQDIKRSLNRNANNSATPAWSPNNER